MNLTLKQVPPTLHQSLKKRAKLNGRSLNMEVIRSLQESVEPDEEALFARVRAINAKQTRLVSAEELRLAIIGGRR